MTLHWISVLSRQAFEKKITQKCFYSKLYCDNDFRLNGGEHLITNVFWRANFFTPKQVKIYFNGTLRLRIFQRTNLYVSSKKAGSFRALFCSALFISTNMYLAFFSDASNWEVVVPNIRIFSKNRYTPKFLFWQ